MAQVRRLVLRGPADGDPQPDDIATVDHIIPVSRWRARGSPNAVDNLLLACQGCNSERRDMPADQYALLVGARWAADHPGNEGG